MRGSPNQVDIIRKAQQGDRDSQNQLAQTVKVRLHEYVYRMTLREDLADDISQETVLEMFRVFHTLRNAERFWNWVCAIAYNKLCDHRHGRAHTSLPGQDHDIQDQGKDAVARMISDELKDIVLGCMDRLDARHRQVLVMRCYQQMAYAEIAQTMGISELGARSLFCRAKKSLARGLARHGLGKGCLLTALVLFGKLTARTPAAAAEVSITGATLQAGPLAVLTTALASKTSVVAVLGAAAVTAGAVGISVLESPTTNSQPPSSVEQTFVAANPTPAAGSRQRWYFYPEGPGGPVMMKVVSADAGGTQPVCRYLQNQFASYFHKARTVTMENRRFYNADLSVMRLPTDSPGLSRFISLMEGGSPGIERCDSVGRGLLVICEPSDSQNDRIWRIDRHANVLDEVFFQYDWPGSTPVVDTRDAIHRQGWAAFTASGTVAGRRIRITGRMPLVYAAFDSHRPRLQVVVDGVVRWFDAESGAVEYDSASGVIARYSPHSLFRGLARPWMGLHTVDTVRRDAAEQQIPFETQRIDENTVQVTLMQDHRRLAYTIDLEADAIEAVLFEQYDGRQWKVVGRLAFSYAQQLGAEPEFPAFAGRGGSGSVKRGAGRIWMMDLFDQ